MPAALSYSALEIESYLPSGWTLEEREGVYASGEKRWQVTVQDISEVVRVLAVSDQEATELGRIPALRRAIDRLYRHV